MLRLMRRPPIFAPVAPVAEGVRYLTARRGGTAPLLDVYMPTAPNGASVVLIHGGGFVVGSRRMRPMRFLASQLVAAGYTAVAVDYRLVRHGGNLEQALDDVRAAVAFWRDQAPQRGLDPKRVSLLGLSAGGMLAMLAAAEIETHRLVCGFGLYDVEAWRYPPTTLLWWLLFRSWDRNHWRSRSPIGAPQPQAPTLLLHGAADRLVPVTQAQQIAARREALGLATRLVVYPNAPHAFFTFDGPAAYEGTREILAHLAG